MQGLKGEKDCNTALALVYITCADKKEATQIGHAAIEARLAACANIIEGATSIYRWENKIQQSDESICLLKTAKKCFPRLESLIKSLHSYEIPCITMLDLSSGSANFLEWIKEECDCGES